MIIKEIVQINKSLKSLVGQQNINKSIEYRLMKYCFIVNVDEGIILYNLVLGTMVLIQNCFSLSSLTLEYNSTLIEGWFLVPKDFDEKNWCRNIQSEVKKINTGKIRSYVILTTTNCNARCFYCFENKNTLKKCTMDSNTAYKVVDFICNQYEGKPITLTWFGGEPLLNIEVINLITNELNKRNICFSSRMHTNAFLFNPHVVKLAVEQWYLKNINVTIDGTEKNYNKIKRYIYTDTNPFGTVLDNLENICKKGITTRIRVHVTPKNYKDICTLIDQLVNRFQSFSNFFIYSLPYYKDTVKTCQNNNYLSSEECLKKTREKLEKYGYLAPEILKSRINAYSCMADNYNSIVISPEGIISKCEHISEENIIGNLESDSFDKKIMQKMSERIPDGPNCDSCIILPECNILKNCPVRNSCDEYYKEEKKYKIKKDILYTYQEWKKVIMGKIL